MFINLSLLMGSSQTGISKFFFFFCGGQVFADFPKQFGLKDEDMA